MGIIHNHCWILWKMTLDLASVVEALESYFCSDIMHESMVLMKLQVGWMYTWPVSTFLAPLAGAINGAGHLVLAPWSLQFADHLI